ncbi:MAG TPA: hypothetical protein VEI95_07170, partial [Acidobacteriota bacterium]|nr:hypothetical protein [Acidobacteriota bacterium]
MCMFHCLDFTRVAIAAVMCLLAAINPVKAHAGESAFGFVITTDLLPKGGKEIEHWLTWRRQKAGGQFDLIQG